MQDVNKLITEMMYGYLRTEIEIKAEWVADGLLYTVNAVEVQPDKGTQYHEGFDLIEVLKELKADMDNIRADGFPYWEAGEFRES